MPATSAAAGLKRSQNRTLKRQQAKTDRLLGNRSVQDRISKAVADAKEEAAVEWIRKLDALKKTSEVRERTLQHRISWQSEAIREKGVFRFAPPLTPGCENVSPTAAAAPFFG